MRRFCVSLKGIGVIAAALAFNLLPVYSVKAAELPPIMPTSEIERGMVGEAFTVVDDTGLQSFRVDVVGLMDAGKGTQSMIMAKASGELIDKVGGVLQGMSGSPVYIDGRLAGAVSAGLKEMRTSTFFITPIEDMLQLWNMPDTKNRIVSTALDIKTTQEENRLWREKFFKKDKKDGKDKEDNKVDAGTVSEAAKDEKSVEADKKSGKNKNSKKNKKSKVAEKPTEAEQVAEDNNGGQDGTDDSVAQENVDDKNVAPAKNEAGEHTAANKEATPVMPKETMVPGSISPRSGWYFSGFTPTAMDFADRKLFPLADEGEDSLTVITDRGTDYDAQLEAGSPMGVALVYGDFSVGATGTVTAVDDKRILGFGHPFLHKGNVSYFLTDASVVGTMSGPTAGVKLATIGNIIGRVSQDRSAGVAGELGVFPAVVPVKIKVKDVTLNREDSYGVRIAYDESFLSQLAATIAYAAMAKTADSLESCTAALNFIVRTDAAEGGAVSRQNMFYNANDVGQIAVLELAQVMNIICSNTDKESNIVDIQVEVNLERGRKTASLISAVPDKVKVRPGDTVKFTTIIKPWRSERQTLVIPYTVPKTVRPGMLPLDIRGGGLVPLAQLTTALAQAGIDLSPQEDKTVPVSKKLATFVESGKNNEVIIAPGAAVPAGATEQKKKPKKIKAAVGEQSAVPVNKKVKLLHDKKKVTNESRFTTDYIIDNVIHSTLQVIK